MLPGSRLILPGAPKPTPRVAEAHTLQDESFPLVKRERVTEDSFQRVSLMHKHVFSFVTETELFSYYYRRTIFKNLTNKFN